MSEKSVGMCHGSQDLNWFNTDALKLHGFDASTCSLCFLSSQAPSRHDKRYILGQTGI